MIIEFELDGNPVSIDTNPMTLLVNALRDNFHIHSVHKGCNSGECGMCSVLIDNTVYLSCLVPVFSVRHKSVMTYEGFRKTKDHASLMKAFSDAEYYPCDYCLPVKLLSIHSLLETNLNPDTADILGSLSGSTCFCAGYDNLIRAVEIAANTRRRKRRVRKR